MAEKINLTFLGTGSAVPTARRNHVAMLLQFKGENILVDCGEGTQRQFRKAGKNPCKVTKILITHWHGDHVFGLPGILNTLRLNGYNRQLEIYGPRGSGEWVRKYMDLVGKRGQELDLKVVEVCASQGVGDKVLGVREIIFEEKDYFVEAFEVDHDCPAVGYNFVVKEKTRLDRDKLDKLKLPNSPLIGELAKGKIVLINGKKVDGKKLIYKEDERKVSFVMDTRYNEGIVSAIKGADLLVCESTYSKEEAKDFLEMRAHLSSVEAAKIAKKGKVKGLVLVHLSQRYEGIPKVIRKEAEEVFGSVVVPEDLDEVEL